jgi:hypothetical protein
MLFSEAILQAKWEANTPFREAMAIKRVRRRSLYVPADTATGNTKVAGSIFVWKTRTRSRNLQQQHPIGQPSVRGEWPR